MEEYSILLVDDEELALRGIEQGIDWERMGITRVFKTHEKKTAIRMLKSYSIDIVLTDIEMPGGTGIELVRWLKENQPQCVSIFYTCHADFAYAQEAVKLGAMDYLLKPVPYDELEAILQRAIKVVMEFRKGNKLAEIFCTDAEDSDSAVNIVKKYISDNIALDIQREELAKLVFLNPDYLSKLFRKQEEVTIGEYITQKRMLLAKQLLKSTNLSIVAISHRVGIPDASYFIKIFRKREGTTPQQYRENWLNENPNPPAMLGRME